MCIPLDLVVGRPGAVARVLPSVTCRDADVSVVEWTVCMAPSDPKTIGAPKRSYAERPHRFVTGRWQRRTPTSALPISDSAYAFAECGRCQGVILLAPACWVITSDAAGSTTNQLQGLKSGLKVLVLRQTDDLVQSRVQRWRRSALRCRRRLLRKP